MALSPVDAVDEVDATVEDIDARVAARMHEFRSIISQLSAHEQAEKSSYEQEVQSLRQEIARNEETVQHLQRENEAARGKIGRLRDDYKAAAAMRKLELEATFGRSRADTQRPDSAVGSSGERTARPSTDTETGGATSPQRESSKRYRRRGPTKPAQSRRSKRRPKPSRRFSPRPESDKTAPRTLRSQAAGASSNAVIGKASGHV
jgi:hypothetical protein